MNKTLEESFLKNCVINRIQRSLLGGREIEDVVAAQLLNEIDLDNNWRIIESLIQASFNLF